MIYLKESFNLHPASPATRDEFVQVVEKVVMPAAERLGARLVGAWFAHEEWFSQILHVTEFDDLAALGAWRDAAQADAEARDGRAQLSALAPERRVEVLEPLGPIAVSSLHEAIEESSREAVGTYTFAILEVAPGRMENFTSMLGAAGGGLPIIACWRDVSGNPDRVIDLWKGDTGRTGYRPSDDRTNAFFEPLRQIAPRERMMRLHPLPVAFEQGKYRGNGSSSVTR